MFYRFWKRGNIKFNCWSLDESTTEGRILNAASGLLSTAQGCLTPSQKKELLRGQSNAISLRHLIKRMPSLEVLRILLSMYFPVQFNTCHNLRDEAADKLVDKLD